jgi:LmbE family N-acetylglucosaminyl deacetylase
VATVLWFAPHQDDETFMGAGVRHHVEAGHNVKLVLCTDGSASAVRQQLGMTVADFVAARNDEFRRASRMLGIMPENITVSPLMVPDGHLGVAAASAIIQRALDEHYTLEDYDGPAPLLKGYTDLMAAGRHPDHANLGKALRSYASLYDVRMYVEPYHVAAVRAAAPNVPISTEHCSTPAAVLRAIAEYKIQDTVGGMYQIGYRSVADELDALAANVASYYHAP